MALLENKVKEQVKEVFKNLKEPVKLIVFTQESLLTIPDQDCKTCKDNRLLIEEVAGLSDKISFEIYDFVKDKDKVEFYKVDKIPATLIIGQKDYGIRLYGLPAGYEFATLLNAIKLVSNGESGLLNETREKLKALSKPIHIQVFVTLTCPYCPMAAETGYKMALENDLIKADAINAQEFPQLTQKYSVLAVPKVVINDTVQFEGALPEDAYLAKILEANK